MGRQIKQVHKGRGRTYVGTCRFFSTGRSKLAQSDINKGNLAETANKTFTKIYNLSNCKLNDIEKNVLLVGLKYTTTPEKSNISELDDDLNEFFRKIRLQEYFYGQEQTDISLVRNKSNFNPPPG